MKMTVELDENQIKDTIIKAIKQSKPELTITQNDIQIYTYVEGKEVPLTFVKLVVQHHG